MMKSKTVGSDPLWYKDSIIYQLHIKAYKDSDNSGKGDIRGLIEKLDYLEWLGVTAVWLLPFYPSPLRDDGYDIADYLNVNKDYGTVKDFKEFLRQAHKRDIRVITELVLNHTSNEHQWFKRSRNAKPGTKWRDMYVWSDTPDKYQDARIIFKDFEVSNWQWDAAAKAYYWHRFYSHQPDLNFDFPDVHKHLFRVIDFWLGLGVDGLRLDAVPYLYQREGTNCENLPETHAFLKKLNAHVRNRFSDKMLLAEANQWPEDAVSYFGAGDECQMAFHFPLMPRMFMAMQMEDSFPIIDIIRSTPEIPDTCQWAIFLRNHDELTLEMVTDEERDYMYSSYANDPRAKINLGIRRRLAPLLGNNRKKIELMNILLFSFPGTPVIYYGDEILMGDNYFLGDRDGVRTPMQWSNDRNAGFSRANPHSLYLPVIIDPDYHYESINVENQQQNLSSMLWWMKRVVGVRKRHKAFSRGVLEILPSTNPKVLTFIRRYEDEIILVAVNLSRFSQVSELELHPYAGLTPEEAFSGNQFPVIKESPYMLTFGPHGHYWLLLKNLQETLQIKDQKSVPEMTVRGAWHEIFEKKNVGRFEETVLVPYLKRCRWFGGKSKTVRQVTVQEYAPAGKDAKGAFFVIVVVSYADGTPENYFLPVTFLVERKASDYLSEFPQAVICSLKAGAQEGVLIDSLYDKDFREQFLQATGGRKRIKGRQGTFVFSPHKKLRDDISGKYQPVSSSVLKVDQSNSSVVYDDRYFVKFYRRIEDEINPELEIVEHLTGRAHYPGVAGLAGFVAYEKKGRTGSTIALVQEFVENTGDLFTIITDTAAAYFENILSCPDPDAEPLSQEGFFTEFDPDAVSLQMKNLIGVQCLELAQLLGKRTAQMHLALCANCEEDEAFVPEGFSMLYQRSLFQSMQSHAKKTIGIFAKNFSKIPEHLHKDVQMLLASENRIEQVYKQIIQKKIQAKKIRIHGDYHLGQVLATGRDIVIIDFEGEPARPLSQRKLKQSSFKDVAGMIRSFHYAASTALYFNQSIDQKEVKFLDPWLSSWCVAVSATFLNEYMTIAAGAPFVPQDRSDRDVLLQIYMLEKAVYELAYELNNRPDWLVIPLKAIQGVIRGGREKG